MVLGGKTMGKFGKRIKPATAEKIREIDRMKWVNLPGEEARFIGDLVDRMERGGEKKMLITERQKKWIEDIWDRNF